MNPMNHWPNRCVARWWQASLLVALLAYSSVAAGKDRKPVFHIEVLDVKQIRVGASEDGSSKQPVVLPVEREYQPGDRIVLHGADRMAVRLDETVPECLLYHSAQSEIAYEIPYGREEKQTGSTYAPEMFAGKNHHIRVRALSKAERKSYRNLAVNPCDWQPVESAAVAGFPHATTNSVSRSLFDFAARNAIDGFTQNGHHGVWPYQSWGPQLRLDLWWQLDFGRPVELDKIRLMVRSDFPHDSYWKSADIEFSDGSHTAITMAESGEFQEFSFPKRKVAWFRLANLVPADEKRWCAFIEVEAWGRDLP